MLQWLFEDRALEVVQTEMRETLAYLRMLGKEVQRKKKRKGFNGKLGVKDLLLKKNPGLSPKISVPEYRLGRSLQALLTPSNFSFFAEKLPLVKPSGVDDQGELFNAHDIQAKSHALVLDVDSLEPMWAEARRRIAKYVRDYVKMMDMEIKLPRAAADLSKALQDLASEIVRLYTEADPKAADVISRQAHRKLLDFNLHSADKLEIEAPAVSNAEVRIAHAYRVLLEERKNKQITQQEFVQEVAHLVGKLPRSVRGQWMKAIASDNNYHTNYAKYLGNTIAPLVATLDKAFSPREIIRVMGHNFEPDYLLKTLDGQTVWGEYLGMSVEDTSAGAHYNIRSEFKKMGYGNKGIFFYPNHITKFPNVHLLQVLHEANVIGFDPHEKAYFVMLNGKKDYIRARHTTSGPRLA